MPTTEEKEGFIYYYWSLFSSIKEGCGLMGIKGFTLYYQPKNNIDKTIKEADNESPRSRAVGIELQVVKKK